MTKKRRLRRLWYVRRRNLKYYRRLLCVTSIILVFTLLWIYVSIRLFPLGLSNFEQEVYKKVQVTVENVLNKESVTYAEHEKIVEIEKDLVGRIVSAKADSVKLTKLSFTLENDIKNLLITEQGQRFISIKAPIVPITTIQIHLGGARVTDVQSTYVTRFSKDGEKDTRLKIFLDVSITYEYLLGERNRTYEFTLWDALLEGM